MEPGLKVAFSPGSMLEPGLNVAPLVPVRITNWD